MYEIFKHAIHITGVRMGELGVHLTHLFSSIQMLGRIRTPSSKSPTLYYTNYGILYTIGATHLFNTLVHVVENWHCKVY